ncbi:aspartate aminotransferase family protein [Desulforhopalus singaporensis]|uniref:4-aminobutyrate aminotransferase n=1 Tax=Desulforhopalus singaporensis TaxID=91360 RepID=A0A1H0SKZ7_9BACT|nr:aminotransferase class III-fold pyridoxal phosphate-dependent enzyme [Desulforhopalus singaporensis]SDP42502.1 4-aminobutyrate aminotransferase [Desulforhopalus singaporensis]
MSNAAISFHGAHTPTSEDPRRAKMIARRVKLLGPSYRLFYDEPFHPVRGEGVWLYDASGDAYLDVYNNVPSVGHCHPKIVEALSKQAATLNTHTRYLHETVLDYAEELLGTLPDEIERLTLTCTGSEANDLALRIANFETGGQGIVVTNLAYHGGTSAVADMSPSLGSGVGDHVRTVVAPDGYRRGTEGLGEAFAADVTNAFADLEANGYKPSVFIIDTIFSSDGVLSGPKGFLKPAVEAAKKAGALVVADEVQPGFGRTGDAFWGFQRHGFVPDIVTMGKPMGAGHPMAGLAARAEVLDGFGKKYRYFNTFGGNPVSCAVGMAVLNVIRDEHLMENALLVGKFLRQGLRDLASHHPLIGDVRGAGLFSGVELVRDRQTKTYATEETEQVVNDLMRKKILISRAGIGGNILKIRPPMPFSKENASFFIQTLDEVLREIPSQK